MSNQKKKHPNQVAKAAASGQSAKKPSRSRSKKSGDQWSWYLLYGGLAVIVAVAGLLIYRVVTDNATGNSSTTAWDLPSLYDSDERITLASLDGRPTVVNFFASWCEACEDELPEFLAAAELYVDEVDFVFVQSQETNAGAGRSMANDHDLQEFLVARDVGAANNELSRNLGARGMPITAFYDEQGNLLDVSLGALTNGALLRTMASLGMIS